MNRSEILRERNLDSLDTNIRPDIIVHERRTNGNNCLVIEIKSLNNDNLAENPDVYDTAKLTYLTCPYPKDVHGYHYDIGFAIRLYRNKSKIWPFVNGKKLESFIVPFDV